MAFDCFWQNRILALKFLRIEKLQHNNVTYNQCNRKIDRFIDLGNNNSLY